mmetsp:Transcript_11027/g.16739  ORF Transcript_11027/g.16739 Transcript_11027/m.16739 type:complete len:151 (+) Transcript_11027:225-677(+)
MTTADFNYVYLNWRTISKLRKFSYFQFALYFLFIFATVKGTISFVNSDQSDAVKKRDRLDERRNPYNPKSTNLTLIFTAEDTSSFLEEDNLLMSMKNPEPIMGSSDTSDTEEKACVDDTESYSFLIAWCFLNCLVILIFAIQLLQWYDIS